MYNRHTFEAPKYMILLQNVDFRFHVGFWVLLTTLNMIFNVTNYRGLHISIYFYY
jgi:hypothetical protein